MNTVCLGAALKRHEIDNGVDSVLFINAFDAIADVAEQNWILTSPGGTGTIKDCSAVMALKTYSGYHGLVCYTKNNDDALATTLRIAAATVERAVVIGGFNIKHPLIVKHWAITQPVVVGIPHFYVLHKLSTEYKTIRSQYRQYHHHHQYQKLFR